MGRISNTLKRFAAGLTAVMLMVVSNAGVFTDPLASAAGQVADRSIKISDSRASNTGTSYLVTFTPFTTAGQSLVIDFCSNSPIIGSTCTAPAGFTAASASFTAGTGTTNWALGTLTANTVKVTKNTGANLGTTAVSFTLGGVTNPSATGTYYARIYTYADIAYGGGTPYTSATALGSYVDYGGFALSTSTAVSVTATIMETLTFCVSKVAPGNGCSGTTAPNLVLGHGSPLILDFTAIDSDGAYTQISSNAATGVAVNMKTTNTCTGLSRDAGVTCPIPGKGAFGTVAAGTAFFGLNVANGTGCIGSVTANVNYGTTAGSYGMGTNTTSTYGDTIQGSTSAVANVNSLLTFAATASTVTPAGVYTATEILIATGTF
jgi:hypothetical protein